MVLLGEIKVFDAVLDVSIDLSMQKKKKYEKNTAKDALNLALVMLMFG